MKIDNIHKLLEKYSIEQIEEYISSLKRKQLKKALIALKMYKDDLDIFNLNSQIKIYTTLKNNGLL